MSCAFKYTYLTHIDYVYVHILFTYFVFVLRSIGRSRLHLRAGCVVRRLRGFLLAATLTRRVLRMYIHIFDTY